MILIKTFKTNGMPRNFKLLMLTSLVDVLGNAHLTNFFTMQADIEELTKERRPKAPPKEKHQQAPPVPEWSESEDSFEKEGTSEEEETPWVETGKKRATSSSGAARGNAPGMLEKEFDLMRDSAKRPADVPSRRRTPKTSPQGGDPESV